MVWTKEDFHDWYLKNRDRQLELDKKRYEKNKPLRLKQNKEYYEKNKTHCQKVRRDWREKNRGYTKQYDNQRYEEFHKFIWKLKKDECCVECGYNEHPEILQFHHNKNNKEFQISGSHLRNLKLLKKEIEKCVLMCPNCHFLIRKRRVNNGN